MGRRKSNTRRADKLIARQVYLGRDANGKRMVKTLYGGTQKEVDKKVEEFKDAHGKKIDVKAADRPFEVFAKKWLIEKQRGKTCDSWKKSCAFYTKFWSEKLTKKISDIVRNDIQNIIDDYAACNPYTGKPSAKKTVEYSLNAIKAMLEFAKRDKAIIDNPADDVTIPGTPQPEERRALTDEEQEWILNTEHRAKRAGMIMMYAGLRRGELISLTWKDIDLDAGTITITKAAVRVGSKLEIKYSSAKSKSSIRVINIPNCLVEYLRNEPRDSVFVCTSAKGNMHTDSSWAKMWNSYWADVNIQYGDFSLYEKKPKSKFDPGGVPFVIPNITPHWLRHTFCTIMYHAGVDILTCQQQMGHADIKTTLKIYTHLDKIYKKKSMQKVDDYLGAKKTEDSGVEK